ncbi:hypothetical protein SPRG_02907 [Saprolegnia parasitica CBS 223.65]|uniref:Nucleoside diphosphate kinase-like domain-containing protein n=1 Tax=Saprolegnia parasitica (strain CBS 223.65) TaxID=695850 RepID=A0A067D0X9_SAPPC|nr:hypothetical protein SPRG_02907 [Saprolegnia parasitica CBS 223.65]KDO32431.1 hypothetical protein SPRG_02907 [Saprolegnia parasitica CBS 223.65]|eukprot:XP_012196883.1 hypothetical protein SPRG_02907 [Saprolegnia parasitica CBS 223.65]
MEAWTERDQQLLRQCVFEHAYDFELAAKALCARLPKARRLALSQEAPIDAATCAAKWQELESYADDDDQDDEDDYDDTTPMRVKEAASSPLLRLELPLSETDLDALLSDITVPLPTTNSSEMQWVLSYLDDPTNVTSAHDDEDMATFDAEYASYKGHADQDAYLASLDEAFARLKRQSSRSVDNISIVAPPPAPSDATELRSATLPPPVAMASPLRPPSVVAAQAPELDADATLTPALPIVHMEQRLPPPRGPLDDDDDAASSIESDTEDEWQRARQSMKRRAVPFFDAPPPSTTPDKSVVASPDDNDTGDAVDEDERRERALIKQWQQELQRQQDDDNVLQQQIRDAERTRRRLEFAALLQSTAASTPQKDACIFTLAPPNPFELSTSSLHSDEPEMVLCPSLSSPCEPTLEAPASVFVAPTISDEVPSALAVLRTADVHRRIEESIAASDLCEPLYHRQLSHGAFLPTLPPPYWDALFAYGAHDDDSVALQDAHVLVCGLETTDARFPLILRHLLQLEAMFPSTVLLGLVSSVASDPLRTLSFVSPSPGHSLARRVLYVAISTPDLAAITASPVAGANVLLADCCEVVWPTSTAHPIHLFTRLPAFQVFPFQLHDLTPRLAPETTVAVLAGPAFCGLSDFLALPDVDVVGCKLCFGARFEANLAVPSSVAGARVHLVLALRGHSAVATLRDAAFLHRQGVYVSHGVLQAKRDVVHWLGGRVVATHATPLPTHLPRPRPLYSIVLKPEARVAVTYPSMLPPSSLGAAVDALARCGYTLTGLHRCSAGCVTMICFKEHGAIHAPILQQALCESTRLNVPVLVASESVTAAIARATEVALPLPKPSPSPPLIADSNREQTLLAVLSPEAFSDAGTASFELPPLGSALTSLLGNAETWHLLGLKLVTATPEMATALAKDIPGLPARLLLVVFRQRLGGSSIKKGLAHVWLYSSPTIVYGLVHQFFAASELHQTQPSPLDRCYPPYAQEPFFLLDKPAPLLSLVVIKPHAPTSLLPLLFRRLARDGYTLLDVHMTVLSPLQAHAFATNDDDQEALLTSAPVVVCTVRRLDAVARLQELVGPTNPEDARRVARHSLIAGYGIDAAHNALYTPSSYAAARKDLGLLYRDVLSDALYDDLTRRNTPPALQWRLAEKIPCVVEMTPKTLVETTLVLLLGPLVDVAGAILPWLLDEGGFSLVNIQLGPALRSHAHHLYWASQLSTAALEMPFMALALERDNAVSRMLALLDNQAVTKFLPSSSERNDECLFACSRTSKHALQELPLIFTELHNSVHAIRAL